MNLQKRILKALKILELDLDVKQQNCFIHHLELLSKWNKVHNLTSIRCIEDMLSLHVFDSLSINKYIQGDRFLDLGSGAGFPGIPLSIANPEKKFILVEANGKKCQFLQYVINELNLTNTTVVQSRIEDFEEDELFDGLLARAVAAIEWIYLNGKRLVKINGKLYLMLARNISMSQSLEQHSQLFSLEVPDLDAQRQLLIITNLDN